MTCSPVGGSACGICLLTDSGRRFSKVMLLLAALSLVALAISFLSVGRLCRWAERHQVLDIPNERSSHTRPIPSGGGLSIVAVSLVGLILYWLSNPVWPLRTLLAYEMGACMISTVSWLDDLQTVPNLVRFGIHSLGAVLAVLFLGYWDATTLPFLGDVRFGPLGIPITFFWIVGLTNAYNFMDGIDGIAGVQAVAAGFGWALLGFSEELPFVCFWGALVAASSLGFLFHNWSPARIFMGDVGSAFLGYSFACLAIVGQHEKPTMAFAGVVMVWPFIFDTVFTLFRRFKRRENIFKAHRSHLYQRLVIAGFSHRTVSMVYAALDVVGVFLAFLVVKEARWSDLIVITVLPLACLGLWAATIIKEKNTIGRQPMVS